MLSKLISLVFSCFLIASSHAGAIEQNIKLCDTAPYPDNAHFCFLAGKYFDENENLKQAEKFYLKAVEIENKDYVKLQLARLYSSAQWIIANEENQKEEYKKSFKLFKEVCEGGHFGEACVEMVSLLPEVGVTKSKKEIAEILFKGCGYLSKDSLEACYALNEYVDKAEAYYIRSLMCKADSRFCLYQYIEAERKGDIYEALQAQAEWCKHGNSSACQKAFKLRRIIADREK